ncbi:SIR2 family protein [Vibrio fluvialis]|nr:SIR2 family protein [Vibrio fluvialis]
MKLGFFFGAGAEIGYGLPSGGKFAIDLFRQDPSSYRTQFREQLRSIDLTSSYAVDWLPQGFRDKRIHAFGRSEFSSLIESSIEYRRNEIIRRLNQFDTECDYAMQSLGISRELVEAKFSELTDEAIGDRLYTHAIKLNELLAQDVTLFSSNYYSAMLDIIKAADDSDDLRRYVTAFLQLLVGAHGQDLVRRLNQELFEAAPDDLPIFDDVSGMFRLEFNRIGSTALELLLEERRTFDTGENSTSLSLLCAIAQRVLENIFTTVLDYQKLIDDHFRYLFSPETEWAKFTKMAVFLKIAQDYIKQQAPNMDSIPTEGYYHDLASFAQNHQFSAIGTANYNSLLTPIFEQQDIDVPDVIHLNGSVNDYYNPYKNSVVTSNSFEELDSSQLHFPFMLTQSGLKPLTSVTMSRRYVELFDAYSESDAIVVVGFGFNKDDSHINGLFRELIENHNKKLFVVSRNVDGTAEQQQRELRKRLRIANSFSRSITVVPVDSNNRMIGNDLWIDHIISELSAALERQE